MSDQVLNILITGGAGQVGQELARAQWPRNVRLHFPTRAELDLSQPEAVRAVFRAIPFRAVINPAAYTAVDEAEAEVVRAFGTNALGPAVLAEVTRSLGIPLVHVSTDYVFDGACERPYNETDPVGPISVYGASKLAGEVAVRSGNPRSIVLRTAWVLSPHRSNFLKTMLRLAEDRPTLRVVDDQQGCPTSAKDVADALKCITMRMVNDPQAPSGTYHFVNEGSTSWAGLAREIMALSAARGGPFAAVEGITTAGYPTPARRPSNSRLNSSKLKRDYGIIPRRWQDAAAEIIAELIPARDQ